MPLLIVSRVLLIGCLTMTSIALAEEATTDTALPAVLSRIRDARLKDDWAFGRLTDLCDKIGPRMSGSRQAEAAVEQTRATAENANAEMIRREKLNDIAVTM